jgi:hypothetical protein
LPQLHAIAFRIHDPAEAAEFGFLDASIDDPAPRSGQQCVEIVDAEVD